MGLQVYMHYPFEREVASTVPRTAYEDRKFGKSCSQLGALPLLRVSYAANTLHLLGIGWFSEVVQDARGRTAHDASKAVH